MSFGGPDNSKLLRETVNQALDAGLILFSSAGNEYSLGEVSYPAAYDGVISVAATDQYDNLASFSNFGQWVDVAAPGVNILSTYPGAGCLGIADCYSWMSGTSMASPIVAGAAAIVFDSVRGADPIVTSTTLSDAVIDAILNNADLTGALGQNMLAWTRHGRLNLYAAITGGGGGPQTETNCSDGVDNDGDGFRDCNDSDCSNDPSCLPYRPKKSPCTYNSDCCSNRCSPKGVCL